MSYRLEWNRWRYIQWNDRPTTRKPRLGLVRLATRRGPKHNSRRGAAIRSGAAPTAGFDLHIKYDLNRGVEARKANEPERTPTQQGKAARARFAKHIPISSGR